MSAGLLRQLACTHVPLPAGLRRACVLVGQHAGGLDHVCGTQQVGRLCCMLLPTAFVLVQHMSARSSHADPGAACYRHQTVIAASTN
jgi:hypothetical protein